MESQEKIRFFLELLNCNYQLHFWQYDGEYRLIETNWNNELFSGEFFSFIGMEKLLKERQQEGENGSGDPGSRKQSVVDRRI